MRKLKNLMVCILLLTVAGSYAQTKQVTGKVTDPTGAPIPGATIKVKGAKTGASAGSDGSFTITLPVNGTLIISGIGYESKEIKPGNSSSLSIQLGQDAKSLSEVVVTGVGTATSKKKLGISVESVTADKLPPSPTASVDQALIGKIPGAQISSIDGTPGAQVNILLRGINTLQGNTAPMILLDGIQVAATNLNTLDLSSIERVEVVQGAASASLYGAQGANGVIQLFTKKGKAGQISIDFASSVARNTYLNVGNVHKARFHSYETDASNNVVNSSGDPLTFDPTQGLYTDNVIWNSTDPTVINNKAYDKNLKYYDHYKEFFVPANTYNNSITVSGAKEKIDFFLSASNNFQESNFKNNGYYSRSNLLSNVGGELFKNFRLRSITQLAYTRNTILSDQGFLYALNNSRPWADYDGFKFDDGTPSSYYGGAVGVNGYNPNYRIYYSHYLDNKIDVVQDFDVNYKLPRFVEFDVKYGINYQNEYAQTLYPNQTQNLNVGLDYGATNVYAGAAIDGSVYNNNFHRLFQNLLGTAQVKLDLENDFKLKIPLVSTTMGGFDFRSDKSVYNNFYGLTLPLATPYTAGAANSYYSNGAQITPFVTYGFIANEKLEYSDIAGVSGGFRTDYSSAFGAGHSPFTFPNANAYLRVSSFNFWKDSKISDLITDFKVRGAFGQAGIQPKPFDRYVTLSQHILGGGSPYFFPATSPNPNLNVEVSQESEVGTDLGFKVSNGNWFKSIGVSVVYWDRKTKNSIWAVDDAPTTGIGTLKNNSFSIGSNGLQFSINAAVVSSRNFAWNFTTNFGHQTSKIISTNGPPVVLTSAAGSTGYVLQSGEKIGQLFGFFTLHSVDQINKETGLPFIDKADQSNYSVASNGIVVNNTDKGPYVTPNSYSFGDPNPKFNVSFINDFSIKSYLQIGFQLDWVYGSHIYNQTKEWMYRDGISGDYDKPISINGGPAEAWTAFYRGMYANVSRDGTKSYFYENSSFLRLRNVSAAFDFAKAFKIKGMKKLQLIVSGRNIWTKTKYTGYDPELSSGGLNSPWDRGTDHNTMPNYKSYQVGLNVGL